MNKCPHGVYVCPGDSSARYCMLCSSEANIGPIPVLPKSSGDPLKHTVETIEFCSGCDNMRLSSSDRCNVCGYIYEETWEGRAQATANSKQAGICPDCGSAVHYEFRPSLWECSDCGKLYQARRRQ